MSLIFRKAFIASSTSFLVFFLGGGDHKDEMFIVPFCAGLRWFLSVLLFVFFKKQWVGGWDFSPGSKSFFVCLFAKANAWGSLVS